MTNTLEDVLRGCNLLRKLDLEPCYLSELNKITNNTLDFLNVMGSPGDREHPTRRGPGRPSNIELEIRGKCEERGLSGCGGGHSVVETSRWLYVRCHDMTFHRLRKKVKKNGRN
ncbi:MAG: hypothetical protein Q8N08_04415 [Methanobacteriaceae archaeon]|nr:hypothetical protein [Methanobacteriaceae archaeon]